MIEGIVGEMVSKQLFFYPDLAIEDKPQGKEGGQAQPAAGDKEQAHSPQQQTGIHGMADIAIRAVRNEDRPVPDGRTNIEMTQAHDPDGPAGQQEGGDEQQQGRKMDIAPVRGCRQQEQEGELTGNKKPSLLPFHNFSPVVATVSIFFLVTVPSGSRPRR